MTRMTGHSNADLAQRGDDRCAPVAPILRTSSALTRPQLTLRTAITIASVVALMSAGTAPATAEDGDTAEGSLAEELASDAASEYARDAKEGLDERRESGSRQQNRADQESREDGSIQERQEERARDEIKDAVTSVYLSDPDVSEAAEDAADSKASSSGSDDNRASDETAPSESDESGVGVDVAIPGAKPIPGSDADMKETGTPGATDGIELGWGAYPGVGPDIYGAEVVGRLANQVLPSGPMGEAGNAMGAGYGGIFGSLAGVEAPSASESGRMQGDGSDGIPVREMGDHIIIYDEGHEGHVVQTVEKDHLDFVTGSDGDWHIDAAGELNFTGSAYSDTDQETVEFGEEEAVGADSESGQEGGSDEDEDTMVFGEAEAESESESNSESESESESESNSESESESESNSESESESESESNSESESSSENGENSEEGEDKADKDEEESMPCPTMTTPGGCGTRPEPEAEELVNRFDDTDEDIERARTNSDTTMPANPEGGKFDIDLPWGILNQLDKTTMPVRPGSMQNWAMPLPQSFWNPGTIDPHRGN